MIIQKIKIWIKFTQLLKKKIYIQKKRAQKIDLRKEQKSVKIRTNSITKNQKEIKKDTGLQENIPKGSTNKVIIKENVMKEFMTKETKCIGEVVARIDTKTIGIEEKKIPDQKKEVKIINIIIDQENQVIEVKVIKSKRFLKKRSKLDKKSKQKN